MHVFFYWRNEKVQCSLSRVPSLIAMEHSWKRRVTVLWGMSVVNKLNTKRALEKVSETRKAIIVGRTNSTNNWRGIGGGVGLVVSQPLNQSRRLASPALCFAGRIVYWSHLFLWQLERWSVFPGISPWTIETFPHVISTSNWKGGGGTLCIFWPLMLLGVFAL